MRKKERKKEAESPRAVRTARWLVAMMCDLAILYVYVCVSVLIVSQFQWEVAGIWDFFLVPKGHYFLRKKKVPLFLILLDFFWRDLYNFRAVLFNSYLSVFLLIYLGLFGLMGGCSAGYWLGCSIETRSRRLETRSSPSTPLHSSLRACGGLRSFWPYLPLYFLQTFFYYFHLFFFPN